MTDSDPTERFTLWISGFTFGVYPIWLYHTGFPRDLYDWVFVPIFFAWFAYYSLTTILNGWSE